MLGDLINLMTVMMSVLIKGPEMREMFHAPHLLVLASFVEIAARKDRASMAAHTPHHLRAEIDSKSMRWPTTAEAAAHEQSPKVKPKTEQILQHPAFHAPVPGPVCVYYKRPSP